MRHSRSKHVGFIDRLPKWLPQGKVVEFQSGMVKTL
jgi:hypothetical protein